MAPIIWTDVTAIATELSTITVAAQNAILAVTNTMLAVDIWGGEDSPKLFLGRCYYAAHLASLGKRKGVPGAVASESAGGLARSYSNPMLGTNSTLQLTSYGMLYMGLAKTTAARAGMTLNVGNMSGTDPGWDG